MSSRLCNKSLTFAKDLEEILKDNFFRIFSAEKCNYRMSSSILYRLFNSFCVVDGNSHMQIASIPRKEIITYQRVAKHGVLEDLNQLLGCMFCYGSILEHDKYCRVLEIE